MAASLSFFLMKTRVSESLLYDSALSGTIGAWLAIGGLAMVVLGFIDLGRSVSVGLPREATALKTGGIHRITRNPLYLGGFLACLGSCLYCMHPLNILSCVLTMVIHHRIVLREEVFLEERFGQQWLEYKQKIPRYLGWNRLR
jgi:protein-S-isoprenylcysteine O-methyltransferase Ste14